MSKTDLEHARFPFQLGQFDVDPARDTISYSGEATKLEPQIMKVLTLMAVHAGEVVSRDRFIDEVWGVEFGADESLTRAISILRKTFKSHSEKAIIETIPKKGYRLIEDVIWKSDTSKSMIAASPTITQSKSNFKGIIAAIGLIAIVGLGLLWWRNSINPETTPTVEAVVIDKSIAVLPFRAFSENENDTYFGRGLSEELINQFASIPDLKVIARTSSFAFDGIDIDVREIGKQLDVAYVMEGSVRRQGDDGRITAQLVRTDDGTHVWSQTFDFALHDLFAVEDKIVQETSRILQAHLGVGIWRGRADGKGVDPAAYQLFLEGLAHWSLRMREDQTRLMAIDKMKQAVQRDPEFADAWAALGGFLVLSKGGPISRNFDSYSRDTENALVTALRLEPENPGALGSMAFWRLSKDLKIEEAMTYYDRLIELEPDTVGKHFLIAFFSAVLGDSEKAQMAYDNAARLDPLNYSGLRARAEFLSVIGHHQEAMTFYNDCFEINCLGEGFVAFGTMSAMLSRDPNEIVKWRARNDAFEEILKTIPDSRLPPVARLMPAVYAINFDDPDKASEIERIKSVFAEKTITDTLGMWGPTFADYLDSDTFFTILETAVDRGEFFGAPYSVAPFFGQYDYPDWVLKHPRYHALWARPGMRDIARYRRENGALHGLPIPADQP